MFLDQFSEFGKVLIGLVQEMLETFIFGQIDLTTIFGFVICFQGDEPISSQLFLELFGTFDLESVLVDDGTHEFLLGGLAVGVVFLELFGMSDNGEHEFLVLGAAALLFMEALLSFDSLVDLGLAVVELSVATEGLGVLGSSEGQVFAQTVADVLADLALQLQEAQLLGLDGVLQPDFFGHVGGQMIEVVDALLDAVSDAFLSFGDQKAGLQLGRRR